ncbi:protein NO VEIN domain-containing protein [Clostridium sporogenes]|uniref:protein NO VEIN domain-containing protein n=1 Tax=Clostridium sporogenes TaxID=1509 RepID=UPI0005EED272|nr:DUF3883 domain-containing protein [Clostridium sporogenes]
MFIKFEDLQEADLIVNAIYKSGNNGNYSDEALSKLMKCENSCGFRKKGSLKESKLKYVVLYSTGKHSHWKDILNMETGEFTYYGDQDKVNKEIYDTPKKGNEVLRRTFENLRKGNRDNIAPFFIFIKEERRDVRFIGLAVPGNPNKSIEECLEVVTIDKPEGQIKNYKAIFTILDVQQINRKWLEDLEEENGLLSQYAPIEWKVWIEGAKYNTLLAKEIEEQIGQDSNESNTEKDLLENINIDELDELVKNIDKLLFEITYKPIDDKRQKNLVNTTEFQNKKKFIKSKRNRDYIEEYTKKQSIGIIGEVIILKNEEERLKNSGQPKLAKKVQDIEWSSKVVGDGLGYDIKSFDIKDGEVINKYIEVKTTIGEDKDFEITANEVEKSKIFNEDGIYAIARVYNLDIKNKTANFYFKEGNLESNYELKTSVYTAHRK